MLETVTGNTVTSDVDALIYVVLNKKEKVLYGELVIAECITL
jgi:hypothetical protein